MKKGIFVSLTVVAFLSCENEYKNVESFQNKDAVVSEFTELDSRARQLFGALNTESVKAVNQEWVKLGKKLYFDNRLSKDNTQSCNTCHNVSSFGVDNKAFSEGNDGGLGGRNSPSTYNAALHMAQFWDGREPDVEAQAGGPILNPVEMAMPDEKTVVDRLSEVDEYKTLFATAFPEDSKPITYSNLKTAIGAYERMLITPSDFDKYMLGDDNALSSDEKQGLNTFIESGCIACHTGPLLGGNMYQKFGLFGNYWEYTNSEKIDSGRFDVTGKESDKYLFKVPSLRNIEKTYPYFHDGSVAELEEAISIMAKTQANKELTEGQIEEIITFFKTLTADIPEELK